MLIIFSPVMSSCLIKCVIRVKQTVLCSSEVGVGGSCHGDPCLWQQQADIMQ